MNIFNITILSWNQFRCFSVKVFTRAILRTERIVKLIQSTIAPTWFPNSPPDTSYSCTDEALGTDWRRLQFGLTCNTPYYKVYYSVSDMFLYYIIFPVEFSWTFSHLLTHFGKIRPKFYQSPHIISDLLIGMLLLNRSGLAEEKAIEMFDHYGVHLSSFLVYVKFQIVMWWHSRFPSTCSCRCPTFGSSAFSGSFPS